MYGWSLDAAAQQRYAAAITVYLAKDVPNDVLCDIIANYHADHQIVVALRDARQPDHNRTWEQWMGQVLMILRREGLAWSSDRAIDSDDLAQIARAALAHALPSFRYQSRFTVWANSLVVRSIRRSIRDSKREKRAVRPDSLDQLAEIALPPDPTNHAETTAHARQFYSQIMQILADQPDQRLGYLFHLATIEDRRVVEIGKLVHLHPSRVRTLLRQIRQLLRDHPAIQAWQDVDSGAGQDG